MSRKPTHLALAVSLIGQLAWSAPVAAGGLYLSEFATSDMGAAGSGALARGEHAVASRL